MHKRIYAQCTINLDLSAESPLLVQGAQQPSGAAHFYTARDAKDKGRVKFCIPASSLKGVWRSAAERILRTFEPQLACDPFVEKKGVRQSCAKRLEDHKNPATAYHASCPACRLFGNTAHAGLLRMADGWIFRNPARPAERTGIAVDRFTGGVKQGALYGYEPLLPGAAFRTQVVIDNVDLWQVGLLALVCRDMNEGVVRLGSGTRKGLGHVRITWQRVEFRYPTALYAHMAVGQAGRLASAQALALAADRVDYPESDPWLLPDLEAEALSNWQDALWTRFVLQDALVMQLQGEAVEKALAPKLRCGLTGFDYRPPTFAEERADG